MRHVGRRNQPARRCGMTLLEVVISIALIALLLGSLLNFFWQTLEYREKAGITAKRTQLAKNILERIASELRHTVAMESVGFPQMMQFQGDRRSITFITTPLPDRSLYAYFREDAARPPARHDLRQISYSLWIDPEEETEEGDPLVAGLLRGERWALDPAETEEDVPEGEDLIYQRHDLWAPEVGYLEFRYFDGAEWTTTWQVNEGNRLPHLVQVTIGYDSLTLEEYEDRDLTEFTIDEYPLGPERVNPNRFSRIIRIPGADEMFSARMNRVMDTAEEVYGAEGGEPLEGGER